MALPCLLYSMDLTVLHLAVPKLTADLRPSSVAASLDHRHLRVLRRGFADHDGDARRPDRPAPPADDRRRGVRHRLRGRRLLDERRDADRTRALLGVAGATIAPSTLSLIRNMFLDPAAAHHGDRRLDHQLLAGRRDRAAGRRLAAGILLVGIGLPARRSRDGAAARRRTEAAAGVPGSRRGPARPAQRAAVAGRRAGDDLRAQADRPGRCRPSAPCSSSWPGLAVGVVFVRRQLRLPDPLLDLRLFRKPAFSASLATYGLSILILFGGFLFLPQYLQLVLGMSAVPRRDCGRCPGRSPSWSARW